MIAAAAGITINRFRSSPLPLTYQSPEQRLDAQLRELISNPAFTAGELRTIKLDEFREIANGRGALILDARASTYYADGHVPDALNLSREDFATDFRTLSPVL